jgi:hypothetical protein
MSVPLNRTWSDPDTYGTWNGKGTKGKKYVAK